MNASKIFTACLLSSLTVAAVAETPTPTPTTTPTETPVEDLATPTPGITEIPTIATNILTSQGIAGDLDIKDRDPVLTFSVDTMDDGVHILADAIVKNEGYSKYPIRVDFFINGTLHTSQIRSKELPTPLGIIVDTSKYAIPFNYTIVATLITPNRDFSTTAYGAVEE